MSQITAQRLLHVNGWKCHTDPQTLPSFLLPQNLHTYLSLLLANLPMSFYLSRLIHFVSYLLIIWYIFISLHQLFSTASHCWIDSIDSISFSIEHSDYCTLSSEGNTLFYILLLYIFDVRLHCVSIVFTASL